MIEDIRLTDTEITDAKIEYFPVMPEDRNIANAATDKANKWWIEKLENTFSYEMASIKGKVRHFVIENDDWQALKAFRGDCQLGLNSL